MIGAVVGLILLVVLLGVLFYCARMLLPLISPILGVLTSCSWPSSCCMWLSCCSALPESMCPSLGFDDGGARSGGRAAKMHAVVGRCEAFLHSSELPDRGFIGRPAQGSVAPRKPPSGLGQAGI
jgi:hypothetical protein